MTLSSIGELPLFKRRAGNEEFEALLDLLPHPSIVAKAHSGRILYVNAEAIRLTAYTRSEFHEINLSTILPGIDLEHSQIPSKQTLVKRNGTAIPVGTTFTPLGGQDSWITISLIPASVSLSTEQKKITESNRQEGFRLLSDALRSRDTATSYQKVIHACTLLTGAEITAIYLDTNQGTLRHEASLGLDLDLPKSLDPTTLSSLHETKSWQPGKQIENALHKSAHTHKLAHLLNVPIGDNREILGVLIAARKEEPFSPDSLSSMELCSRILETIRWQSQEILGLQKRINSFEAQVSEGALLLEYIHDAVLLFGPDLTVQAINPAAQELLGYPSEQITGMFAADVLVGENSLMGEIEASLETRKMKNLGDRKLHRRDGSEFLASIRLVPIFQESMSGKLLVFLSDLSEREALHIRSQQLQQRAWLGEVTAIFAHEVRNPINNISTGLQLMKINLPADDPLQKQVKRLQEDCDRLDHRMNSVLSFSRHLDQNLEPIDIGDFARQQVERWRPKMNRRGIKDHLQLAKNTPLVIGDRRSLDQVFTNLITNAIQAMQVQPEGLLAIKIGPAPEDAGMVDIHISDNGPGIPNDLRDKVFDPFFTTKEDEGTGLGLAITRRIVLAHKGEINLESFPGGTLFKIRLPAANEETLIEAGAE
jgi:two-component system, NtrC family, sensor histidine kinase AtoS